MQIDVHRSLLSGNRALAAANHDRLQRYGLSALNLLGSPGAGKTSLLEVTLRQLQGRYQVGVIEGDVATAADAERVSQAGAHAVQINTRGGCHLDARMVAGALGKLPLAELDLLIIENVGNLVCPADFELGEALRVTVLSVTEGEDKVSKYPAIFRSSSAVVLNKIDLLPYTSFRLDLFAQALTEVNPRATVFQLSARTGEGVAAWVDWLAQALRPPSESV